MSSNLPPVFFSIIIPAFRECEHIENTCSEMLRAFDDAGLSSDVEILVVEDNSGDGSAGILKKMAEQDPRIRPIINEERIGFGASIIKAFDFYRGQAACITMADLSDTPEDAVAYYKLMKDGAECVYGSRFVKGGKVLKYPRVKLFVNRCVNALMQFMFWVPLNDITGAFKCYHRKVIDGIKPINSSHFSITVEMPLRAIVRGYTYKVIPITWVNRREDYSNLNLKRQAPRYLYAVLCVWLEKWLTGADYKRTDLPPNGDS